MAMVSSEGDRVATRRPWVGGGSAMEYHGIMVRFLLAIFWYPLINLFPPPFLRWFIRQTSRSGDFIISQATTHAALEEMYGYSQFGSHSLWDRVWLNCDNCRAARNRLRMIRGVLMEEVACRPAQEVVRILSIGCGSARSVLEVVAQAGRKNIKVTLLDQRQEALDHSRQLAAELLGSASASVEWIQGNFFRIRRYAAVAPDVVELAGLLDYFEEATCVRLLAQVAEMMRPGGLIIVTNGQINAETPFVLKTAEWPLDYKTPDRLSAILVAAGFHSVDVAVDPIGIQVVARGRKA